MKNKRLCYCGSEKLYEKCCLFLDEIKRLIQYQPEHHDGFWGLARVYKKKGERDKMIYFYDQAIIGPGGRYNDTDSGTPFWESKKEYCITHYKEFWDVVKINGISIHLHGKPMEVYMRQDMWVNGRKLTKKEKKNKQWKREFYDYYQWRLRHCQKADCTVRIVGNKQTDTENLCKKIAEIIPLNTSDTLVMSTSVKFSS